MADAPVLDGLKIIEKLAHDLASCRTQQEDKLAKEPEVNIPGWQKLVMPGLDWQLKYSRRDNQLTDTMTSRRDCEGKAVIEAQSELIKKTLERLDPTDTAGLKALSDYLKLGTTDSKISEVGKVMFGPRKP
jgi:hypothetical protein